MMKKAIIQLAGLLILSCLLPLLGYYGAQAAATQDAEGTLRRFLTDAQGTGSYAEDSTALPPAATAAPDASRAASGSSGTAAPADSTVLVQDTGSGVVMQVPLREYLIGSVASEMPMTWPDAALQAQAVASHTYVLYCKAHNNTQALGGAWLTADPARRQGFMPDTVLHSYWSTNYDANYARLSALVDAVIGTTVVYQDEVAATSYFAISCGRTEASQNVWGTALRYLQGVDSSLDTQADSYETAVTYSSQQMYDALVANLGIKPDGYAPEQYFSDYQYTDAGNVSQVNVCGTAVQGTVLRSALHLRSACFSISYAELTFTIVTHGYGHDVGMSQMGARMMAERGSTWQDILQHYFPGTELRES